MFKYAVREVRDDDRDCKFNVLTLGGACGRMDPLESIRNAELLLRDDAIVGVNVDGQCVIRKDLLSPDC